MMLWTLNRLKLNSRRHRKEIETPKGSEAEIVASTLSPSETVEEEERISVSALETCGQPAAAPALILETPDTTAVATKKPDGPIEDAEVVVVEVVVVAEKTIRAADW